jgi:hypothetical protein
MSTQPPVTPQAKSTDLPAITPPPKPPEPQKEIRSAAFWIIIVALLILWLVGWRWCGCGLWIHLLLLLALTALLVELLSRGGNSKNIEAHSDDIPNWDPARPEASLTEIHIYVLDEAAKSTQWYWKNKGSKAFLSRLIRFAVWALAAVGGLLPIIGALLEEHFPNLDLTNGLWASLLLGIAAALLGLDKGFGFSSGWARYVLTATNIRKSLEEFRLDWTVLRAKAGSTLTVESVAPLIERAKQFRSDIEGLVLQETKDWVTEFQSTMAQMEKDVAAQVSNLKAQVDKTIKEREAASQPGAIQLNVQSNGKAKPGELRVTLTDSQGQRIAQDMIAGFTWPKSDLTPGFYHLTVEAPANNQVIPQAVNVIVKPGDVTTVAISL